VLTFVTPYSPSTIGLSPAGRFYRVSALPAPAELAYGWHICVSNGNILPERMPSGGRNVTGLHRYCQPPSFQETGGFGR
jgi:hypothetical protein